MMTENARGEMGIDLSSLNDNNASHFARYIIGHTVWYEPGPYQMIVPAELLLKNSYVHVMFFMANGKTSYIFDMQLHVIRLP